jgi:putative flippase GtrA
MAAADRGAIDHRSVRHWGGFLFSGGTAFLVDAGITLGLIRLMGLDPFLARLVGIAAAMVVAWMLHRRITFNVAHPPSLAEFLRYATVAGSANGLNYAVYAAILLIRPAIPPFFALIVSTGVAMVFSYLGFRLGVFRRQRPD